MNQLHPIRVLVADDHEIVREGLKAILDRQEDISVVGEAANGKEAVDCFRRCQPDIILMDLRMPGEGGLAAIQAIRKEAPGVHIIVLTTYDGDENIYRAITSGAKSYLLKTAPQEQILETIRAVNARLPCLPSDVASQLAVHLSAPRLTPREHEVLGWIAQGKSNQEIGDLLFICEGTVKAHINNILNKLEVSDRTQAALSAIKRGLIHLA
jgi:two-component system NarL family response regulator